MPEPGTPMESLMLLIWRMRQDIDLSRTYVLTNAIIASSADPTPDIDRKLQKSWSDFVDNLFPFQAGRKRSQDSVALEYLKQEVERGPLQVTPLAPLTAKKKSLSKRRKTS